MTLTELLESKFRGDIRFRGAAYVQAERVSITRVTADQVFAVVRDGVEYQTQLLRQENQLRMYCTCASGNQQEISCKHLWATILSIDEGGYMYGTAKPGVIPPFAVESEALILDDDEWEDATPGDVYTPANPGRTTRTTETPVAARLRDWEVRLRDLRKSMDSQETTDSKVSREREIFYEIDIEQSRKERQLIVETSQRQRRANGQWGKLKPLKLRPGRLEEIEHEDDRRILAYLTGGTPERTNWYAQQAEFQAATYRYRMPVELCELILPMMCATHRVRFLGSEERTGGTLAWDAGPPWQLNMAVEFDDPDKQWRLVGRLRRDDELLPIENLSLLVPGGLVLTSDTISRLDDFGAFGWADLLLREQTLTVDESEAHELVDQLLDMPALPRLDLPEELRLEEITARPIPHLVVHSPRGTRWQHERLLGEIHFDYLGVMIRGGSRQAAIVQRDRGRCILRDRALEEQYWTKLQEHGFRRLLDQRRSGFDVEIAARDLGPAVRALIADNWQIRADGKQVRQPAMMNLRVKSGIDWFELHGDVNFDGSTIAFPELLSALMRGDTTVRLDDGSLGILPEEWIRQYGLLAGIGVADEDHIRFSTTQVGLLDALLATQESVEFDDGFLDMREKMKSFQGVGSTFETQNFQGNLRGYQRDGVGWLKFLQEFRFGGCLADDMGLGKTVQMLAMLQDRVATRDVPRCPTLIVVPKSLLFNWAQECVRFTPNLKHLEYTGIDRAGLRDDFNKYDLILTTYGTLRRDIVHLKDIRFDYVVLDEAQSIKNAGSQVAKASRLLQANQRLALSGTPIENHLNDLWSIFEFLNPGMLGRSSVFRQYSQDSEDKKSRELLAAGLRPFILRRTKKQVASELPDKVEQTILCRMGKEQERRYMEMREHYRSSLQGMVRDQGLAKSKMHVLEALLRLRQVACHPGLLDPSLNDDPSAKLDVLIPHIEELLEEGHKMLIFSQFTSMLSIVRKHLDRRKINYEYLDGQTRDRKKRVEHFQEDDQCGVFLISLKAGGLGLNLTAADYVFLLDPWWNPAVETQAIDRAHRVGQTRQVFAYRLICQNTVEEKIAELQGRKRVLADAILQENSSLMKDLSADDLEMLFS